jgi:hypothetical protein
MACMRQACVFERRITPNRAQLRGVIAAFGVARAVSAWEVVVGNASVATELWCR